MNPNERNSRRYGNMNASMSRGGFIKTAGVAAVGVGMAATGLGGVARAGHGPSDFIAPELIAGGGMNYNVWPSGDLTGATDVQNVQWCVDNVRAGGHVQLKAQDKFTGEMKAFDFGAVGSVRLTKNVSIIGETDAQGNPLTTINNGRDTFYSPLPNPLPNPLPAGPSITIQGINFIGSKAAAIYLEYCGGASITGNTVSQVIPIVDNEYAGYYRGQGISIFHRDSIYREGAITGNIEISGNYLDLLDPALLTWIVLNPPTIYHPFQKIRTSAIAVSFATNATVHVAGNAILHSARLGTETLDHYNCSVTIENNTITAPAEGAPKPSPHGPHGILVGWFYNQNPTMQQPSTYVVQGNNVTVERAIATGGSAYSAGVFCLVDPITVSGNTITFSSTTSGINRGIQLLGTTGATVENNTITGPARWGILVTPLQITNLFHADSNTIRGNDLSGFTPIQPPATPYNQAHVMFLTQYSTPPSSNHLFSYPACSITVLPSPLTNGNTWDCL